MAYRSQPLSEFPRYAPHRRLLVGALAVAFALLAGQLVHLSIFQHAHYAEEAEDNLYAYRRLAVPRGDVFDREGRPVVTNRRTWSVSFSPWGQRDEEVRATLRRLRAMVGAPTDARIEEILLTRPRWTRHTLLRRAEQETVLPLLEQLPEFRGVRVADDFAREYRWPTEMAHVTGYVGKIQAGEEETYTYPRYLLDDEVGRAGLERAYEDSLAGHPGLERQRRDARSRRLAEPEVLRPSEPGQNLYLSIDAELQAYAQELLRGRTGTVLLMEAETGALIVAASSPTFDATRPGASMLPDGREVGWLNLGVRGQYPPGSTFKIVGAAAALAAGISPDATYQCSGAYYLDGWSRPFHCAHRYGHGPVDLVHSLEGSCNVYYFKLAEELGPEPLRQMAAKFGFGAETGTDLAGEKAGSLPRLGQLQPGERTNFSIGQGKLLATPLQVARSYAAVANGGWLPTPHVVESVGLERETAKPQDHPRASLGVPRQHLAVIAEGLYDVVNRTHGTAYKAGFPRRWQVAGKTGTVERGAGMEDAWFAGFLPYGAPTHVFVVHLEDVEGHGGDVAAPVAKQLLARFLGEDEGEEVAVGAIDER